MQKESFTVAIPGIAHIKINKSGSIWEVSEWFTSPSMQNRGIGSRIFKQGFNHVERCTSEQPSKITYVWNGENEYVRRWLDRFGAKCTCPVIVLKNMDADVWEAHIYELDVQKVLEFSKDEEELGYDDLER